jgi:hypothetical protein
MVTWYINYGMYLGAGCIYVGIFNGKSDDLKYANFLYVLRQALDRLKKLALRINDWDFKQWNEFDEKITLENSEGWKEWYKQHIKVKSLNLVERMIEYTVDISYFQKIDYLDFVCTLECLSAKSTIPEQKPAKDKVSLGYQTKYYLDLQEDIVQNIMKKATRIKTERIKILTEIKKLPHWMINNHEKSPSLMEYYDVRKFNTRLDDWNSKYLYAKEQKQWISDFNTNVLQIPIWRASQNSSSDIDFTAVNIAPYHINENYTTDEKTKLLYLSMCVKVLHSYVKYMKLGIQLTYPIVVLDLKENLICDGFNCALMADDDNITICEPIVKNTHSVIFCNNEKFDSG